MEMTLSPQQQAAVDFVVNGKGSLNLIARAGCGKTFTLLAVAAKATGQGVMLAYNKSIALELGDKLAKSGIKNFTACTVHSLGFRAWRKIAPAVKTDEKKVAGIITTLAAGNDNFFSRNMGSILKLVSLAKQSAFGFGPAITDNTAWFNLVDHHGVNDLADGDTVEELVSSSITVLTKSIAMDRTVIDFDDMILAPLVHNVPVWQYDWVLLDEAQDTNAARRALALKSLKPQTGRLIAVGDDRQAIYGFTGADSDALDIIKNELHSTVLPLTVTYRCPKAVVAEANKLVPDLQAHESAPDGEVEALDAVNESTGEPWFKAEQPAKTSVILCRNTKPLVQQAYQFLRYGIGCRVEGREIGQGLIALVNRWSRIKTLSALRTRLEEYKEVEMQKWLAKGHEERAQAVEDKVETVFVILDQLLAQGKDQKTDFISFVYSLFGDTKPGEVPNVVTLSTIHKSKGREWNTVYLLDRAGTLPSGYARKDWQLNQEANLEYVAITRAKRRLVDILVKKREKK